MSTDDVVILSAARTPLGKIKGTLASFSAVQLGTIAVTNGTSRSRVVRFRPARLSRMTRKSSSETCVNADWGHN